MSFKKINKIPLPLFYCVFQGLVGQHGVKGDKGEAGERGRDGPQVSGFMVGILVVQ